VVFRIVHFALFIYITLPQLATTCMHLRNKCTTVCPRAHTTMSTIKA